MWSFKIVFYGSLVLLSCICARVLCDVKGPRLTFQPMPPPINGNENTLIWLKSKDLDSLKPMVNQLSEFLAAYKNPTTTSGHVREIYSCDYNRPPPKGKACAVDIESFASCRRENNFNYDRSTPCIFLKIENTDGWTPEFYNDSKSLPENMPEFLRQHINEIEKMHKEKLNTVWVSCDGTNPVDRELIGPVQYMPQFGFPGYFFQQENPEDYLSPLVALKFERPLRGIVIFIECKLWARNIVHDSKTKVGMVEFELLVD